MMPQGYMAIVLHAHLPYVRHPEYESFYEETWLFEAIIDTYVPLLRMCERLAADGCPYRLTLSFSPPLLAMLADPFLQSRFVQHLHKLSQLGDKEIIRNHGDARLAEVARLYRKRLYEVEESYLNQHKRDLIGAFRQLQDAGHLDLITAGATHGYLPILKTQPCAVRAQLKVAADAYRRAFGRDTPGFWLPECGYFPGVEDVVAEVGGRFFFVETHGVMHADPSPRSGYLAPLACPNGVAAFARDPASGRQVWSSEAGYPGDPWYRDFFRDIGFDADWDYIRPFILDGHTRVFTGFKYHRITGTTDQKEIYEPERARERSDVHAADFLKRQVEAVQRFAPAMDRPPLIVALYDAELFGHWWFEGPQFLELFIRKMAYDQTAVALTTPADDLSRFPKLAHGHPSASSWGDRGYSSFWLNSDNDWIYRHLYDAAGRMHDLVQKHPEPPQDELALRALNQAARSLLLAQASDWAFIMKTGTNVAYAEGRIRDHLARFHVLADAVDKSEIDPVRLEALEAMDAIFPNLDYRVFA